MSSLDPPASPADTSYPDVDPKVRGESWAVGLLTDWVKEVFKQTESLRGSVPRSLWGAFTDGGPFPQVWRPAPSDQELSLSGTLWSWIIVASREPDIAKHFGASAKPFSDEFLPSLDLSAFSSTRRQQIQRAAGLTSRR